MDAALTLQGFLQSLGWAILHSFWQMALLWLVYQVLFGWRSRLSPTLRHNAAFLMLTGGSVWFLVTFGKEYTKFWQIDQYLSRLPDASHAASTNAITGTSVWEAGKILTGFAEANISYLSALYLLILSFMAWKLLQGFLQAKALRREGLSPAGAMLEARLAVLMQKLAIPQEVKVYISQLVDVPATLGFLKPVILLPVASLTQLSPAQLETILLHELAHIRRMDYLLNIGVALMETMHFHNPFAWLLVRSIRRERELCCDDIVLSYRQDAIEYASALLSLEKGRRLPTLSMALASNGHKGQLLHRVRRMTSTPTAGKPYADRLLAICLTFLLMASMAWMKPGTTQAHTMPRLAATAVVEEEKVWILNEPLQNMMEKPRQKAIVIKEKVTKQTASPSATHDVVRVSGGQWETLVTPSRTPVYINEAPPEDFRFLHEESPKDIKAADILLELSNDALHENQRMQNLAQERAMAQQEHRMQSIELEKLIENKKNSFYFRSNPVPEQQVIIREFRNAAEARTYKQQAPTTRPRSQEPSRRPSAKSTAPAAPRHPLPENELKAMADELHQQQIFLLQQHQEPVVPGQTKARVKVNRVKTKDGYALRIVTGTESIDIRIGEDDLIVEKD